MSNWWDDLPDAAPGEMAAQALATQDAATPKQASQGGDSWWSAIPDATHQEAVSQARANQRQAYNAANTLLPVATNRSKAFEVMQGVPEHQRDLVLAALADLAQTSSKDSGRLNVGSRALTALGRGVTAIANPIREMTGMAGDEDMIERLQQADAIARGVLPSTYEDEAFYKRWPVQAAEMTPAAILAAKTGGALGGLAKAAGAGAAGTAAATAAGVAAPIVPMEYRSNYAELREMGVDDAYAKPIAAASALVVGLLESVMVDPFAKLGGGVDLKRGATRALKTSMLEVLKRIGTEVTEEAAQSAATEVGNVVASYLDENVEERGAGGVFKRAWDDAVESIGPLTIMVGAPGAVQVADATAAGAARQRALAESAAVYEMERRLQDMGDVAGEDVSQYRTAGRVNRPKMSPRRPEGRDDTQAGQQVAGVEQGRAPTGDALVEEAGAGETAGDRGQAGDEVEGQTAPPAEKAEIERVNAAIERSRQLRQLGGVDPDAAMLMRKLGNRAIMTRDLAAVTALEQMIDEATAGEAAPIENAAEGPQGVPESLPAAEPVPEAPEATDARVQTIAGKMDLDEFEAKGYAPEQVTRSDWVNLQRSHRRKLGQSEESGTRAAPYSDYELYHEQAVRDAVANGDDVDPEVLADYPDIAQQKAEPATQPAQDQPAADDLNWEAISEAANKAARGDEDAAQDALKSLFEQVQAGKRPDNPEAWVTTATKNNIRDRARMTKRRRTGGIPENVDVADTETTPDENAIRNETMESDEGQRVLRREEFLSTKPKMARGPMQKDVSLGGKDGPRVAVIEELLAEGATVERGKAKERHLILPNGNRLPERLVTKTGMDYAEYLLAKGGAVAEPEAEGAEPTPKEPWQMTREEYVRVRGADDEGTIQRDRYNNNKPIMIEGQPLRHGDTLVFVDRKAGRETPFKVAAAWTDVSPDGGKPNVAIRPSAEPGGPRLPNEVGGSEVKRPKQAAKNEPEAPEPVATESKQPDRPDDPRSAKWRKAEAIGQTPKALGKRLRAAKASLTDEVRQRFGAGRFDFSNRRLLSDDGTLALQWTNTGATTTGSVSIVQMKGTEPPAKKSLGKQADAKVAKEGKAEELTPQERSSMLADIGMGIQTGRSNPETEQAVMQLVGLDSLQGLGATLKSASDDVLREAHRLVEADRVAQAERASEPAATSEAEGAVEKPHTIQVAAEDDIRWRTAGGKEVTGTVSQFAPHGRGLFVIPDGAKNSVEVQFDQVIGADRVGRISARAGRVADVTIGSKSGATRYADNVVQRTLQREQDKGRPAWFDGTYLYLKAGKHEINPDNTIRKMHDLTPDGLMRHFDTSEYAAYNRAAKELHDKQTGEAQRRQEAQAEKERLEREKEEQKARTYAAQREELDAAVKKVKFTKATLEIATPQGKRMDDVVGIQHRHIHIRKSTHKNDKTPWQVSHAPSGSLLSDYRTQKEAKVAAMRLAEMLSDNPNAEQLKGDLTDEQKKNVVAVLRDAYAVIEPLAVVGQTWTHKGKTRTVVNVDAEGNIRYRQDGKEAVATPGGWSRSIASGMQQASEPATTPPKRRPPPDVQRGPSGRTSGGPLTQKMSKTPRTEGDSAWNIAAQDILATWEKRFNLPMRAGGFRGAAAAIYKRRPKIARYKEGHYGNLAPAAHEIAHHVDAELGVMESAPDSVATQVAGLDYNPNRADSSEGFAEYLRLYMTDQNVDERVPEFHQWFQKFIAKHPDWRQKIEQSREDALKYGNQSLFQQINSLIAEEAGQHLDWGERWKQKMHTFKSRMIMTWINRFHIGRVVDEFLAGTSYRGPKIEHAMMTYSLMEDSEAAVAEREGVHDATLGPSVKIGTASLFKMRDQLRNDHEYDEAIAYTHARHTLYMAEKKPGYNTNMTPEQAEAWVEHIRQTPEKAERFEEFARLLAEFNNDLLEMLVRAKAMSPDDKQRMIDYYGEYYMPLHRVRDKGAAGIFAGAGYVNLPPLIRGRSTGGSARPIIDPIDATMARTVQMYKRAHQTRVAHLLAQALDPLLGGVTGAGGLMDRISPNMKRYQGNIEEILDTLVAEGVVEAEDARNMKIAAKLRTGRGISRKNAEWFAEMHGVDLTADNASEQMRQAAETVPDATAVVSLWRPDFTPNAAKRTVIIYDSAGKPMMYELDPLLYETVTGMNQGEQQGFTRILAQGIRAMGRLSRAFKMGAVGLRPAFGQFNLIRDFTEYQGKAKNIKGLESLSKPLGHLAGYAAYRMGRTSDKTALYREFEALGGKLYSTIGPELAKRRRFRRRMMGTSTMSRLGLTMNDKGSILGHGRDIVMGGVEGWADFLSITDVPPRLAEMEGAIRAHGYESTRDGWRLIDTGEVVRGLPEHVRIAAAHAAGEATVNFKRYGTAREFMEAIMPFSNAGIQATVRQWQQIKNLRNVAKRDATGNLTAEASEAHRYLVYVGALMAGTIGYWMLRKDDDDWKEQEPWLRDFYWTWGKNGKTYIRLPKPYNDAIFSNIVLAMLDNDRSLGEAVVDDITGRLPTGGGLTRGFVETFVANYDWFRQRDITPHYLKNKPPELQTTGYETTTSQIVSKAFGKYIGVSPIEFEHLMESATGGAYRDLAQGLDKVASGQVDAKMIPGVGKALVNRHQARSVESFYDAKQEATWTYDRAQADGKVPPKVAQKKALFDRTSVLMAKIRQAEPKRMGKRTFEYEPYIVGLARESLGKEPLESNPSPFRDPDLPVPLKAVMQSEAERRMERALLDYGRPKTKHQGFDSYAATVADWEQRQAADAKWVRDHKATPIVKAILKEWGMTLADIQ